MKGKHKGCRNLYIDERDRELYRAFCKARQNLLNTQGTIVLADAVHAARTSPTSRYFVSEQRASEVLRFISKEIVNQEKWSHCLELPIFQRMRYQTRRMYLNLYMEYVYQKQQYPNESHDELVTRSCMQPAPEFFLSQHSATDLLSNIHNNKRKHGIISSNQKLIRDARKQKQETNG